MPVDALDIIREHGFEALLHGDILSQLIAKPARNVCSPP